MSLRRQVEEMVEADDGWEMPPTPAMLAKRTARAVQGWYLLIMRLMWYVAIRTKETVLAKWQNEQGKVTATTTSQSNKMPAAAAKKDHKATEKGKKANMMGKPLTPSARNFPVARVTCKHEPEFLQAKGNKSSYWWTCMQCGSRWERLNEADMEKEAMVMAKQEEMTPCGKMVNTDKTEKNIVPKGRLAGTGYPSEVPAMPRPASRVGTGWNPEWMADLMPEGQQRPESFSISSNSLGSSWERLGAEKQPTAVEEANPQLYHTKMMRRAMAAQNPDVPMDPPWDPR